MKESDIIKLMVQMYGENWKTNPKATKMARDLGLVSIQDTTREIKDSRG